MATTLAARRPWGQKKPPYGAAKLDPAHPLNALGVAGCWLMNEEGGDEIFDISGNNNTGTLTGGVTWTPSSRGPVLNFNGANYILLPAGMAGTPQVTMGAWVYWIGSTGGIIELEGGANSVACYISGNHGFEKGGVVDIDSGIAPTANTWEFIVWTLESDLKPRLYVNASLKFTSSDTSALVTTSRYNAIGGAEGVTTPPNLMLNGMLDSPFIFPYALTAAQVLSLYERPYEFLLQPRPRRAFGAAGAATGGLLLKRRRAAA